MEGLMKLIVLVTVAFAVVGKLEAASSTNVPTTATPSTTNSTTLGITSTTTSTTKSQNVTTFTPGSTTASSTTVNNQTTVIANTTMTTPRGGTPPLGWSRLLALVPALLLLSA